MNKKKIFLVAAALLIVIGGFGIYEVRLLHIAHSTFEDYYRFRGCEELIEKTDTYGTCKVHSGEIIKMVLIDGKWYLDGDGPGTW